MENKKTNWGLIIGIVVTTVAVLAAGAFLALKLLQKKKCECEECELDESDICVLEDECEECVADEATAEADAE